MTTGAGASTAAGSGCRRLGRGRRAEVAVAPPAEVAAYLATLPGVETFVGDVTDPASCTALLSDCSACLALHGARRTRQVSDLWRNPENDPGHAKQINYGGVANLIAAARASDTCKRLVRLTGKGETPWSIFSILINGLGSMAKVRSFLCPFGPARTPIPYSFAICLTG